jgi:hypothetical protein
MADVTFLRKEMTMRVALATITLLLVLGLEWLSPLAAQKSDRSAAADAKPQLTSILSQVPKPGVTPTGLLPTALEEARVATAQAALAAQASELDAIREYAANVLHALDPTLGAATTGQGVGVRPSVLAVVEQLKLLGVSNATGATRTAGERANAAAANVLATCDAVIEAADATRKAKTVESARAQASRMAKLTMQLTHGTPRPVQGGGPIPHGEGGLLTLQLQIVILTGAFDAQASSYAMKPVTQERPRPTGASAAAPPAHPPRNGPPTPPPFVLKTGASR